MSLVFKYLSIYFAEKNEFLKVNVLKFSITSHLKLLIGRHCVCDVIVHCTVSQ